MLLWVFLFDGQINDYVAGYHDGALLFGKVLRETMLGQRDDRIYDVPLSDNPFGNTSFYGVYMISDNSRLEKTMGDRNVMQEKCNILVLQFFCPCVKSKIQPLILH